jgi:hypothetical protein
MAKKGIEAAKAKAAAKDKADQEFVTKENPYVTEEVWKGADPIAKEALLAAAKKEAAIKAKFDAESKSLVEKWAPSEAGGWSGLTAAEKAFAVDKALKKQAAFVAKDDADFALAKQTNPGLKKEDWDGLPEGTKATFVKKTEDMIQKAQALDQEALDLVKQYTPEAAKDWASKTQAEKNKLQEAAELVQAKKVAGEKAAPDPAQIDAEFVAKWNKNFSAEDYLASGPVTKKYALKLAQSAQAKFEAAAVGKATLKDALASYTIPQLKSIAKAAGIDVASLNNEPRTEVQALPTAVQTTVNHLQMALGQRSYDPIGGWLVEQRHPILHARVLDSVNSGRLLRNFYVFGHLWFLLGPWSFVDGWLFTVNKPE